MVDELLPHYERELTYLRRLSGEFSARYPKIAGRLLMSGETVDDPHVERMIESFAFLAARIHRKLDDEFPQVTDALLQVLYPHYLRPFPSASIAHFDGGSQLVQLSQSTLIPRGTLLNTRAVKNVECRFRTAYDVELAPIAIDSAGFDSAVLALNLPPAGAKANSAIRIDIAALSDQAGFDLLALSKLRMFLNGEPSLVSAIREALCSRVLCVTADCDGETSVTLDSSCIEAVGFSSEESLVEQDARSHPAYRILLEYFAFPDKFNFVDIDLRGLRRRVARRVRNIRLGMLLGGGVEHDASNKLLERLTLDNFALFCTPVVNLFAQAAEPVRVTHRSEAYPLIVDSRRPQAHEIYSVERVTRISRDADGERFTEFRPFYALRHGEKSSANGCYWHLYRREFESDETSPQIEIALVDAEFLPAKVDAETLSIDLVCTNRDLPAQLPFGLAEGDLFAEGGSAVRRIRMLRKPTRSHRFNRKRGVQWRLISHLSLNHLSLSGQGIETLQEALRLYDISESATARRQIEALEAIEQKTCVARVNGNPFPSFVRGIEVRLTLDESGFVGSGLHLFAQVLDRFFGLYVQANSFTQLILLSKHTGRVLVKCPPRNGDSILA